MMSAKSFPEKVYCVLQTHQNETSSLQWTHQGTAIRISMDDFDKNDSLRFFQGIQSLSFTRRLARNGFRRIAQECNTVPFRVYAHPMFQRDHPDRLAHFRKDPRSSRRGTKKATMMSTTSVHPPSTIEVLDIPPRLPNQGFEDNISRLAASMSSKPQNKGNSIVLEGSNSFVGTNFGSFGATTLHLPQQASMPALPVPQSNLLASPLLASLARPDLVQGFVQRRELALRINLRDVMNRTIQENLFSLQQNRLPRSYRYHP